MPTEDLSGEPRVYSTVRKRALPGPRSIANLKEWQRNTSPPPSYAEQKYKSTWSPSNLSGSQVTASEYHPSWKRRLSALQDVGGNFSTTKQYVSNQSIPTYRMAGSKPLSGTVTIGYEYNGYVLADGLTTVTFPPSAASTDSVLDALGAEAIADLKPTNSVANLAVALTELYHEGLPRVIGSSWWKDLSGLDQKSAQEYLNLQFGWKPLQADITDFARVVYSGKELIEQFLRDSGRPVRRRGTLASTKSEVTTLYRDNVASPYIGPNSGDMFSSPPTTGKVYRYRKTTVRRWFSGAFTYHAGIESPAFNRLMGCHDSAQHLLGLELTPDTLWNLAPWSWAADWVSSLGAVISNLTDYQQFGLVMPYGYLMEHSIVSDTYYWSGPTGLVDKSIKPTSITLVTETKLRRKANPFGFGLTWKSLSDQQTSILAALGISRHGQR